jgi:serine/threonine protein kinase
MITPIPSQNIVIGDFEMEKTIGRGGFAAIHKTIHKSSNIIVLIKSIQNDFVKFPKQQLKICNEIELHRSFNHHFITEFYDFFESPTKFYIALEYVSGKYKNHGDEFSVKKIIFQLLLVLENLHDEKHVCHRDIKLENILSDKNGNIRLIDFGSSRYYEPSNPDMQTTCGSPYTLPRNSPKLNMF